MKKLWFLPFVLILFACKPKEVTGGSTRPAKNPADRELRAALEVMKNEVNEYVELNQDVKMEFEANRCMCRYFVGHDFAGAEMRWTMRLQTLDIEGINIIQEEGMTRVAMLTIGRRDEILFEEGEQDPLNVNEFNVYLSPDDGEAAKRYVAALTTAIQRCSQEAN
jgi:hypothetical protein